MNGVALAYGLARGGPAEARATLARFWERGRRAGPLQPAAADPARPGAVSIGDMDFSPGWLFWDALSRMVSPYRRQSGQLQPAGRGAGRGDRLRLAARAPHRPAVRLRHQRQDRQDPRVRLPRDLGQGDFGLGLPAVPLPGGRDRRRVLLGRRLHGQPAALPADLPDRLRGRADRPDQPDPGRRRCRRRHRRSSTG